MECKKFVRFLTFAFERLRISRVYLAVWVMLLKTLHKSAFSSYMTFSTVPIKPNTNRTIPLYPDADELHSSLYGQYKLGIVTNGIAALQRKKWHGSGLETWFDAVAISGEVGIGKPEIGIFEWIAQELEVNLEECVMVGDNSDRDVQGGRNAGMKTVWLDRGFKPKTVNADLECQELLEILPWLEQL